MRSTELKQLLFIIYSSVLMRNALMDIVPSLDGNPILDLIPKLHFQCGEADGTQVTLVCFDKSVKVHQISLKI